MSKTLVATRPRRWVLALSIALLAATFALRVVVADPLYGVGILFFVPIALAAIEYGMAIGLVATAAALVLSQAATGLTGDPVPFASYGVKAVGYMLVGGLTGWMADRLRSTAAGLREGARHFELSGDLLCTADFDGYLIHANDAWEQALGWTAEEIRSRPFIEFVHPDDREHTIAESTRNAAGTGTATFSNRYQAKDGGYRWLEWSSRTDLETRLIYAVARDVTARRATERSEREARERFRRIFDDSFAGIALVGLDGKILEANRGLAAFLGHEPGELVGKHTLTEFAGPKTIEQIGDGIEKVHSGASGVFRDEIQVKRSDGELVWVDLTISLIRDADGKPLYRLSQMLDIQVRKKAEEKLRHLADHDPLSGVFNRRRFELELELELGHEAQHARSSAVLLFDIDDFKRINDSLGHAAGDAAIAQFGRTLQNHVRTGDAVSRLGGDEFAILLRRIDLAGAERVATKIRERAGTAVAESIASQSPVGISVGIAMVDGASSTSADLILDQADAAMYEAKRAGGNRVSTGDAEQAPASVPSAEARPGEARN